MQKSSRFIAPNSAEWKTKGMSHISRLATGFTTLAIELAVSSCTGSPPEPVTPSSSPLATNSASAATQPTAAASASTSNEEVLHHAPEGETVIGYVDDMTGDRSIAGFEVIKPIVMVYLQCHGDGELLIEVKGHGSFPLSCEAASAISVNEFNVAELDRTEVAVSTKGDVRWAGSVTSLTVDEAKQKTAP